MTSRDQLQETLCSRLFWHTAERDDAKVADHLFHRREMDVVYAMDEATLFDSFFNYLREINVFPLLENLDPHHQQRKNVPFIQMLLVFLMKVVGSIKTIDEISDLLLTDELLMSMCGFNAHQVKNGSCDRGTKLRKTPPPQIRGSLCVDTVANHIVTITPRRIENFFNRSIQQLAKQGIFPKKIHASCDCTLYETTSKFKGCGSVTRKVKVKARGYRKSGELKEVTVTLYGWKVWAIYEIKTGIPLAIKIDTIEKPDNLHVLAVLEQAKENVKVSSIIDSLVIDRGFLDGKVLYEIDRQGIEFVIPLKRNMDAAKDARQLALDSESFPPVTREVEVVHGYGKKKYTEKVLTTLVGVPDLLTCDWFNPEGSKANTTKKDYEPIPLNAVVVKKWDNKTPPLEKQVVFVTNIDVRDPFITFDRYDERSLMENNLFREVKQNWHLEHPPKKTKEGVYIQTYTTMAMKALTTAFLKWQEEQLQLEALGKQTTWQMYRRKLKVLNRNKLIVFIGSYFGIFPSHEVFMLANVPVYKTEEELNISREQIYAKYTDVSLTENS
ncbi:MAG: transposase [Deltaproteobacteria bacterium]|nr:transposase [Deltaproteobacteria bacterium]